eukprot:5935803-Pyramimonas_sp.AAC.1
MRRSSPTPQRRYSRRTSTRWGWASWLVALMMMQICGTRSSGSSRHLLGRRSNDADVHRGRAQ